MYPRNRDDQAELPNSYRGAEFVTLHGDAAMTITDYYDLPNAAQHSYYSRRPLGRGTRHKYSKSGLNSEQVLEYKQRLEQIMRSQKLFQKPDLSLPILADALDCSVNHMSQIINFGCGMSFFEYLNHHRIELAMELLANGTGPKPAILDIALAVGFNSNSTFYAAFKKRVGQSPA